MEFSKIVIFIGQYLDAEESCTALEIQKFINAEEQQGGFMLPLGEIQSALMIMKFAKFLDEIDGVFYPHYRQVIKEQKIIQLCNFDKAEPLYSGETK